MGSKTNFTDFNICVEEKQTILGRDTKWQHQTVAINEGSGRRKYKHVKLWC